MTPIQKEVFDELGNLRLIEVIDAETSQHMADFLWDPNDDQTPENRNKFRDWVTNWVNTRMKGRRNGN